MTAAEATVAAARAAADRAFPPRSGAVVYADRALRGPGSIAVGETTVTVAAPAILVFRDEQPGANWMHACSYALVDAADGSLAHRAPADRPPVFGLLPTSWVVASDPDGLADLLPHPSPDQEAHR